MSVCPSCGAENAGSARFCSACGAALEGGASDEVRKTVTVVFCDVSGSTAMSERLDPESVRRVMGDYFQRMREAIERHEGTVEKFIGDAVMAVFGIPTIREDDALRAVRAADEMRSSMVELNQQLLREFGLEFRVRIGVNTGEVVSGDPSSGQAFATGDTVNVAARFEQAAPPGEVLIGESTYRMVRDAVDVERVEPLELKGKSEPIPAYHLRSVTPGASGIDRRLDVRMVGRDDELELLERLLAASTDTSSCRLVTLIGEAGVGKSRLVHEFLSRLGERATIVRGRCLPYGEGITYWPITEVVRSACGIAELDPRDVALSKLASVAGEGEQADRVIAGIAGLIGLGGPGLGPEETFWAVRRFLEALGREQPMAMVLDDIQWGEPTFLDLVEYLLDFSGDFPLFLVCLARADLLEARPSWGSGRPNADTITLEPLSEDDSERLMEALLGSARLPSDVSSRISETSGGNPLFAQEMLRMLIDDGLLVRENEHWSPVGDLSRISVPPTIHALLASRLERLDQDERSVAQRASVVGKVFQWSAVAALSPDPARAVVGPSLQRLVRKELIRPDTVSFVGEDGFRFSHLLIRDAAYLSTPKRERAALHRRFASWLESRSDAGTLEHDEIRGYHLEQAYRYAFELGSPNDEDVATAREAAELLARCGIRARQRGDPIASVRLLDRAIALTPEDDRRVEWQLQLLEGLRHSGEIERARATLGEIDTEARRIGDRRLRAHVTLFERTFNPLAPDEQEPVLHSVIGELEDLHDDAGLARAWMLVAFAAEDRGRSTPPGLYERSIEHAHRAGETTLAHMGIANLCNGYVDGPMPVPQGTDLCARALSEAGSSQFLEAGILRPLGALEAMADHFDEARRHSRRSESILQELGHPRFVGAALQLLAEVELLAGHDREAELELRLSFEALRAMGDTYYMPDSGAMLARALLGQGRLDEAADLIEVVRPHMQNGPVAIWHATYCMLRALLDARRGDTASAVSGAREGVAVSEGTDLLNWRAGSLLDLAEVLQRADRSAEALPPVREAIALYERKQNVVGLRRARAFIDTHAADG